MRRAHSGVVSGIAWDESQNMIQKRSIRWAMLKCVKKISYLGIFFVNRSSWKWNLIAGFLVFLVHEVDWKKLCKNYVIIIFFSESLEIPNSNLWYECLLCVYLFSFSIISHRTNQWFGHMTNVTIYTRLVCPTIWPKAPICHNVSNNACLCHIMWLTCSTCDQVTTDNSLSHHVRGGKTECQFDWCVWNRNTFLQGCRVDFVVGSNTPLLVSVTNQKSWKNLTTGNQRPWYYDKCWHYTAMGYYGPVRNTGWKS